jgi:hypothetical protein
MERLGAIGETTVPVTSDGWMRHLAGQAPPKGPPPYRFEKLNPENWIAACHRSTRFVLAGGAA